jgi:3-hydroxymyristoyl/3-hydroxydecanoyl-(acyl carrier protein) dehydratase
MKIASSHPALQGHFPDQPIVPAVVILDHLMTLWQQHYQSTIQHSYQITQLLNSKFMMPLVIDQDCSIDYHRQKENMIQFMVRPLLMDSILTVSTTPIFCKGLFQYE